MKTEAARFVGRGSNDTARASATNNDRLPLQLGTAAKFNADKEGVHVDVQD